MHVDAEAGDGRGPEHGLVLGRREGAAELVHPANKPTYTSIPFLYFLPDKFLYVTTADRTLLDYYWTPCVIFVKSKADTFIGHI